MHLNLLNTLDSGTMTLLTIAAVIALVSFALGIGLAATSTGERGEVIAMIITFAIFAGSLGTAISTGINVSNIGHKAEAANTKILQTQAQDVYGVKLSGDQAYSLLEGADGSQDKSKQEYGDTLLVKAGGKVQKVQLVYINGTWLIIDAGTRSELPHA